VTAKKNDCPRPFPHTGHKRNHCLWYINNLSYHFHYKNDCPIWTIFQTGKCFPVRKSQTTFQTRKDLPILDHFSKWKMIVHKSMIYQCSLPTWRAIASLSAKGVISMIPNLYRKYANFIVDKGFFKISIVFSSVEIYWSFTSPSCTLYQIK
jgi:hypothetical protein